MAWFLGWLICAFGAAFVASSKNRGGKMWFLLGLLLGPIALIIVGFSAPLPSTPETAELRGDRLCPFCAEEIKPQAIVCKHCGREVPPQPVDPDLGTGQKHPPNFAG